jgi:hypothetical protein
MWFNKIIALCALNPIGETLAMIFRLVYNDWQGKDKIAALIVGIKIPKTLLEINSILKTKKYLKSNQAICKWLLIKKTFNNKTYNNLVYLINNFV